MAWKIEEQGTPAEIKEKLASQIEQSEANTASIPNENRHVGVMGKLLGAILDSLEENAPDDSVTIAAGSSAGQVPAGTLRPEFSQVDIVVRLANQKFPKTSPAKPVDKRLPGKPEKQPANVIDE